MSSESSSRVALVDIAENIHLAQRFIEGMNYETFCGDPRTVYAVTRCLEIISEASRRLPNDLKAQYAHIPWSDIAGAGNVYRHDYEDVEESILWRTVQNGLTPLLRAVKCALAVENITPENRHTSKFDDFIGNEQW